MRLNNMSNYSNKDQTFFKKIILDFNINDTTESMGIKYNLYQYAGYYSLIKGIEITPPIKSKVEEIIWQNISFNTTYYEPRIYDSLIALKCNLLPFVWQGHQLLASSLNPYWQHIINIRLDAYQALTHKTIYKKSLLFTEFNFFERVIGKELTKKILEATS